MVSFLETYNDPSFPGKIGDDYFQEMALKLNGFFVRVA